MVRTQVYLTEGHKQGLERLAKTLGRKQSQLIREALDDYLAKQNPSDWKQTLEAVHGMWADRDDLDSLVSDLRREADQRLERQWRPRS